MPLSPLCQVQIGANPWVATLNGVDTYTGAAIGIRLADTTGVTSWYLQVIGTDETSTAPTLANVNPSTNLVTTPSTVVTFSNPFIQGVAFLFQSTVTGVDGTIVTTFTIYIPTALGDRVGAVGEAREGDQSFGWITKVNPLIRNKGSHGGFITDITTAPSNFVPYRTIVGIQQYNFSNLTASAGSYYIPQDTFSSYNAGKPAVFDFDAYGDVYGGSPHPTVVKRIQGVPIPDPTTSANNGDALTLTTAPFSALGILDAFNSQDSENNGVFHIVTADNPPVVYTFLISDQTSEPTLAGQATLSGLPAMRAVRSWSSSGTEHLLLLTADSSTIYIVQAPSVAYQRQGIYGVDYSTYHVVGILSASPGTFGIPGIVGRNETQPTIWVGTQNAGIYTLSGYDVAATIGMYPAVNATPINSYPMTDFAFAVRTNDDQDLSLGALSANNFYSYIRGFSGPTPILTLNSTIPMPGGETALDFDTSIYTDVAVITNLSWLTTFMGGGSWISQVSHPGGFTPGKVRVFNTISPQNFSYVVLSGAADGSYYFPEEGGTPVHVTHAGEALVGSINVWLAGIPYQSGYQYSPYMWFVSTAGIRRYDARVPGINYEYNTVRTFVFAPAGGFTAGGDLTGTSTSQTVARINGGVAPSTPLLADVGKVIGVTGAGTYGLVTVAAPGRHVLTPDVTANYQVLSTDDIIPVDSTGGLFTVTLTLTPTLGEEHTITDVGGQVGVNPVTISGNGNNIIGAPSYTMVTPYDSITVTCTGVAPIRWSIT